MANGIKTYQIKINGVTESIDAVKSLNDQLKSLEDRIKALESKSIGVKATSSTGGGSKSSSTGSLSEEEKLQKQINQLEEKRIAYSKEIYQNYLAAKDVLSETVKDQKSIAATERLQANAYSNTIQGMKQELADIKSAMQTVDLGDTDQMDKMVQRANELNEALKKIEESYGQFGRNVGNYSSAFDGLDKVRITIGDTVREFGSAREALKTLNNELKTMAVNGQDGTKAFKALQQKVMELESAVNDAKKPMDNLMDTMESVMAIANLGQGIRALFGIDDAEIQRSIQKLVALQNVMKGIEAINKQIQTREGIGKWIAPLNAGVDTATKKLLVLNRAFLGTGNAAKVAAVSINVFSKALKVALSAGVLIVVDLLIEKLMDLVESFKKVDKAAEEAKETQRDITKAYAEATAKIKMYQAKVKSFNGTQEEEKRLVKELNSEFGSTLGTYDSLAKWMDVLVNKGEAYIGMLVLQAKAQASFNKLVKDMEAKQDFDYNKSIEDFERWYDSFLEPFNRSSKTLARQREEAERKRLKDILKVDEEIALENQKKLEEYKKKHGIGEYAPQIETNNKKTKQTVEKNLNDLNDLELRLMRDGLYKRLRQLDEEERQILQKLSQNAKKNEAEIRKTINTFDKLREKEIQEYSKEIDKATKEFGFTISGNILSADIKEISQKIKEIDNNIESSLKTFGAKPVNSELLTKEEICETYFGVTEESLKKAQEYLLMTGYKDWEGHTDEYYDYLKKAFLEYSKWCEDNNVENTLANADGSINYEKVEKKLDEMYAKEIYITKNGLKVIDASLKDSFESRLALNEDYQNSINAAIGQFYNLGLKLEKEKALKEEEQQKLSLKQRYDNLRNSLQDQIDKTDEAMTAIENVTVNKGKEMSEKQLDTYNKLKTNRKKLNDDLIGLDKQQEEEEKQIEKDREFAIIEGEKRMFEKRERLIKEYNERNLKAYDDLLSKTTKILNSQPVEYKSMNLGRILKIPNLKQTLANINEAKNALSDAFTKVRADKIKLEQSFKDGLISQSVYDETLEKLNAAEKQIKDGLNDLDLSTIKSVDAFVAAISAAVNVLGQSIQSVLSSVWDYQDYQFEKEQYELDKLNEELDKKLDEQQEIVEKHKDAIDSIEDELSTARGDRRQHLIDQLNAEMQAQRAAAAQEKKIQREKEAAEKKQEQLEKKRREEEYKRNVIQAFISWHMAIANGLATQPFLPVGIAMGALATALGAVQYALVKSQKPYAKGGQLDGGVAQGKRHRDGGIPVLGGRASIEGGEFITNRITTQNNVALLDYINSKKKRIDLSDMIEFYGVDVKKNIKSISPRTVFADGGVIPTISNDIDINDRLITAFEKYSEKPTVVSVVDINNRQNAVKNVQVLAGLSD